MFKHVLIPTDGSSLSKKAVKAGIAFAKEFGATVGARGLQGRLGGCRRGRCRRTRAQGGAGRAAHLCQGLDTAKRGSATLRAEVPEPARDRALLDISARGRAPRNGAA